MSRLFVRLIFSGSKFNFLIICNRHTSLFYSFIIIVTKARCTSLDHLYFIDKCLGVGSVAHSGGPIDRHTVPAW